MLRPRGLQMWTKCIEISRSVVMRSLVTYSLLTIHGPRLVHLRVMSSAADVMCVCVWFVCNRLQRAHR